MKVILHVALVAALAAFTLPLTASFEPRAPLPAPKADHEIAALAGKIEGAFGFRLGDPFIPDGNAEELTASVLTEKAAPGSLYRVTPAPGQGNSLFDTYFVLRTLKTHQIAAIYAAAEPRCQTDDGPTLALARMLTLRHSPAMVNVDLPLVIKDGARQIVLQCTSRYLKLVYADTDLAYAYAREAAEVEARATP